MTNYIQATTTKTGLTVTALVNERTYAIGKKIPDDLFNQIPISNYSELPAWNYTIPPG